MSKKQSGTDNKNIILDGAFATLKKHGLPMISYDRIAEAAGLSRQVVRYHFPDQEDMMVALCARLASAYSEALISKAVHLTGPSRIDMFLDFFFDIREDMPKPRDDAIFDAMMSFATGSEKVRDALIGQYSFLGKVLAQELRVAYPALSQAAADELSFLFVALMYGHWKMVATLGASEEHKFIARQGMERLIRSFLVNGQHTAAGSSVWMRST